MDLMYYPARDFKEARDYEEALKWVERLHAAGVSRCGKPSAEVNRGLRDLAGLCVKLGRRSSGPIRLRCWTPSGGSA